MLQGRSSWLAKLLRWGCNCDTSRWPQLEQQTQPLRFHHDVGIQIDLHARSTWACLCFLLPMRRRHHVGCPPRRSYCRTSFHHSQIAKRNRAGNPRQVVQDPALVYWPRKLGQHLHSGSSCKSYSTRTAFDPKGRGENLTCAAFAEKSAWTTQHA